VPPGSSSSSEAGRLRIWLEPGESGYWLRDAATGDAMKWDDPRVRVVKLAGASYRADALQDEGFAPGRRLALVPEPENEHDPNAVAVWDGERRLQAGYVPAEVAPELSGDEQAVSLWEFRGEDGQRIGLRVLLAPADAWIQEPRS
jgi:HIRAN domain-containing protein